AIRKRLAMFVLRSKVSIGDASERIARFGVGGPQAASPIERVLGAAPPVFGVAHAGNVTVLALPGRRYYGLPPRDDARIGAALADGGARTDYGVWAWLTIHAGIPTVTAATQDKFVPQTLNWDVLGGINFKKGCYTGQEIIARMHYLGRLKERLFAFRAPDGA